MSGSGEVATTRDAIPVLDVSGFLADDPEGSAEAVAGLRDALEHVGFFLVVGHGLDWSLVDSAYAETRRFFALPLAEKKKIELNRKSGDRITLLDERGYIGLDGATYGTAERGRNNVESLYLDYETTGRNRWPENLPGFRERLLTYLENVDRLAHRLLPLYARALALPDDYFAEYFREPTVGFRISHYPPAEAGDGSNEWGIAPHTDRSFMTLLPTNDVSGLQIRPEGCGWINAPVVPHAFVVNSGDTLKRWSNDRFLSTPHRVARPVKDRYAIPYFFGPSGDVTLETLPTCISADVPPRYEPINVRQYDLEFLRKSYRPNDARLVS